MKLSNFENITPEQFVDRVLATEADALVKISNAWSGADQMLGNTLQELATLYSSKLDFFSVDTEADSDFCKKYLVDAMPTLLFFKKGILVDKLSGLNHRNVIVSKMDQLINSINS
jgi:thioredoxin 1